MRPRIAVANYVSYQGTRVTSHQTVSFTISQNLKSRMKSRPTVFWNMTPFRLDSSFLQ
jgi:hypothetical protein